MKTAIINATAFLITISAMIVIGALIYNGVVPAYQ